MCKHCEKVSLHTDKRLYYKDNDGAIIWHELYSWGIEIRSKRVLINYCPWCGRKLERGWK